MKFRRTRKRRRAEPVPASHDTRWDTSISDELAKQLIEHVISSTGHHRRIDVLRFDGKELVVREVSLDIDIAPELRWEPSGGRVVPLAWAEKSTDYQDMQVLRDLEFRDESGTTLSLLGRPENGTLICHALERGVQGAANLQVFGDDIKSHQEIKLLSDGERELLADVVSGTRDVARDAIGRLNAQWDVAAAADPAGEQLAEYALSAASQNPAFRALLSKFSRNYLLIVSVPPRAADAETDRHRVLHFGSVVAQPALGLRSRARYTAAIRLLQLSEHAPVRGLKWFGAWARAWIREVAAVIGFKPFRFPVISPGPLPVRSYHIELAPIDSVAVKSWTARLGRRFQVGDTPSRGASLHFRDNHLRVTRVAHLRLGRPVGFEDRIYAEAMLYATRDPQLVLAAITGLGLAIGLALGALSPQHFTSRSNVPFSALLVLGPGALFTAIAASRVEHAIPARMRRFPRLISLLLAIAAQAAALVLIFAPSVLRPWWWSLAGISAVLGLVLLTSETLRGAPSMPTPKPRRP